VEFVLMFGDGALSFREFAMGEQLPLATIHDAVLEFLRGREDAVLYGAQAVNAYVDEPRMTQDVDVMSPRAADLAEEIRCLLNDRFHIAARVRDVREGLEYRVYQLQKLKNRHLVDVRPVPSIPPTQRVQGVLVIAPPELVASKLIAYHSRRGKPKSGTDWRDLAMLLLTFPKLKADTGPVAECLLAAAAPAGVLQSWRKLVQQDIRPEGDDDEFA
jgi:hypothetical protein